MGMSRYSKDYYCEECCCNPCCCKKVKCVKKKRVRNQRRPVSILPILAGVLFVALLRNQSGPANNRNVNVVNIGSDNEDDYEYVCESKCSSKCEC
jgi:hypothetical protein